MGKVEERHSSFVTRHSFFGPLVSLSFRPISLNNFLILYLYWVAFEWIIVSRIPSYALIQSLRNTIDVLPLAFLIGSMVILNIKFKSIEVKVLAAFLGVIVISVLSLALERGPVSSVSEYIGVTIRFVPLLVLLRFASDDFHEKLFPHIKAIYWILVGLAVINLINKEAFLQVFLPPAEIFGEVLPTTYKDPGISASFINTVEFAFFFLALTVIYLNGKITRSSKTIIWIVSSLLIVFSFSIASILALLGLIFLRSKNKWLVGSIILGGLLVAFLLLNNYIEELLGMDIAYWIEISSEFNRLGYFTKILPEFLSGQLKDLFLGMGYDAGVVDAKLANYSNTPLVMINNENNLKYLKDVYWLSILFAQGLIALGLTFYVLRSLWKSQVAGYRLQVTGSNQQEPATSIRQPATKTLSPAKTLILLVLFLGFFNQILDIKAFTYIFWLTMALGVKEYASNPQSQQVGTSASPQPAI